MCAETVCVSHAEVGGLIGSHGQERMPSGRSALTGVVKYLKSEFKLQETFCFPHKNGENGAAGISQNSFI